MLKTIFIMPNKETDPDATLMIVVDEVTPETNPKTYQYVYVGNINDLPSDVLTESSIVNDLSTGGTNKPLSAEQGRTLNSHVNYTTCGSEASDEVKLISDDGFELSTHLRLLVKMNSTNTHATPKFNINNTGIKDVWYNGAVASDTNTWSAGEVVDVCYDGTKYIASTYGGAQFATGEKVKEVGIDSEPTAGSENLVKSGGITNENKLILEKSIVYLSQKWLGGGKEYANDYGKQYCYTISGVLAQLSSQLAAHFGVLKVDVSKYNGKIVYLKTANGGDAYNLFVDEDNNVLSYFHLYGEQYYKIPANSKYLLLSNGFSDCPEPIVGTLTSDEENNKNQNALLTKTDITVTDGFYNSDLTPASNQNYNKVKFDVSSFAGKLIKVRTQSELAAAYNIFTDENDVILSLWRTSTTDYDIIRVPDSAKWIYLSNYKIALSEPEIWVNEYQNIALDEKQLRLEVNEANLPQMKLSIRSLNKQDFDVAIKTCVYFNQKWLGGGKDYVDNYGVQYCYSNLGVLTSLSNTLAAHFGVLKVDVSKYIGKTLLLNTANGSSAAYNVFVDSSSNVISTFQQMYDTPELIEVPANSKYLLLSNGFSDCPEPIVGVYYTNTEYEKLYGELISKLDITIKDNSGYGSEGVEFANANYNSAKVDVSKFVGKLIKVKYCTSLSGAYSLFTDESNNVISNWRSHIGSYTEEFILVPDTAKWLLISNDINILSKPEVYVNTIRDDVEQLKTDVEDMKPYIPTSEYVDTPDNFQDLSVPTLDKNSVIIAGVDSEYTETQITNPIEGLKVSYISKYTKTSSGDRVFPCDIEGREIGSYIGIWLKLSDFSTSYLRIHCGVFPADQSAQRAYKYVEIDKTGLQVGNVYSATEFGFTIAVKCVAIVNSQYVCFSVVVTSTNELDKYFSCLYYDPAGVSIGKTYESLFISDPNNPFFDCLKVKIGNILKTDSLYEKLCLPEKFIFEKGKTAMLFKRSMFQGLNYRNYNIQVFVTDDPQTTPEEQKWCKDYDRYIQYTPLAVGEVNARIVLYDVNRNILDEANVVFKTVERTTQPDTMKTVLFVGDSLTYYNRISDEFYRLLTSNDAATTVQDTTSIYTVKKPAGRNWSNIQLIGTQKNNPPYWIGQTYHEGHGGWQWSSFIGYSSPFKTNGQFDFADYLTKCQTAMELQTTPPAPDVVYIGLGWNDGRSVIFSDNARVIDISAVMASAKTFLDAMTTAWPNAKIRLWTENITGVHGGVGNHSYGAAEETDEQKMNLCQFAIIKGYKTLIQDYQNVDLVWSTAFVDSEYSLQEQNADINTRIAEKEVRGVDYVHPADSGYFQITDAIVADFCSLL